MMERIIPNKLDGGLDAAYFKDLDDVTAPSFTSNIIVAYTFRSPSNTSPTKMRTP